MNKLSILTLKVSRKIYTNIVKKNTITLPSSEQDPDIAYRVIYDTLMDNKPCMIARFGSTELTCLFNYLAIKHHKYSTIKYIIGQNHPWWWEAGIINQMQQWSGFFPASIDKIEKFCELMLQDIPQVDILGSWLTMEDELEGYLGKHIKVNLELLNPYFSKVPWTRALKGKKVLVVHPFVKTIESQYEKRKLLFENDILPEFELKTIKAVQSIANEKTSFSDWFEALDYMKAEIDKQDYDVCLIGCGAYGFPLAAHIKRSGKKGFHMGGTLQLLFGIKGKRWEGKYNDVYNYSQFFNNHWVRPSNDEKPLGANKVENACYW